MLLRLGLGTPQKIKSELYAWGDNTYGMLGDNTTTSKSSPILVSPGTGISWSKVAIGYYNTVALKSNGSLWAWGDNSYGQLGQGWQSLYANSPINAIGNTTWAKVSAGNGFVLAIRSNGTLYAWGDNASGQLGDVSVVSKSSPVLVSGPAGASWAAIAAGSSHSLGITTTGQIYGWGENFYGQVGNNNTSNVSSPVALAGAGSISSWTMVAAGTIQSFAITIAGTLYAWGYNSGGALGDLTTVNKSSPVLVSGPAATSWATVSASDHSLAITTTGRLYAWGPNDYGGLGDLTVVGKSSPVLVSGPAATSWSAVEGGRFHSLGITTNGTLYAWGTNYLGMLGDLTTIEKSSPVLVSGPVNTSWSSVSCGSNHSLAITNSGRLYAWGYNNVGQLGDASLNSSSSPVLVSGPASTSWIAVSGYDSGSGTWALTSNNILWGWGSNTKGALGLALGSSSPLQVGSSSWSAVSIGVYHVTAITTSGVLHAWGYNNAGQLGDLSTIDKASPILVSGPAATSWAVVANGGYHTLATTTNGQLYGWGNNTQGAVGNFSAVGVSSPVLVSGPAATSWALISGGFEYSLGITTLGRLYAWGANNYGQLGVLSTINRSSPVLVSGPATTSWAAISGGQYHTLAISALGRLYAWGRPTFGRLGDNQTGTGKSSPILVSGPANTSWSGIAAGDAHSLAITNQGRLYAWGYNASGQLGDLTTVNKSSPIAISGNATWSILTAGFNASAGLNASASIT